MSPELDEKLVKAFPNLYADRNLSMTESCLYWGFECSDGWFKLIWGLSEKLEKLIKKELKKHPEEAKNYKAAQVKEKFGFLHFYMVNYSESMHEIINDAEKKSTKVCEICGKKGKCFSDRGWWVTRCTKCKKK